TIAMIDKYRGGIVPAWHSTDESALDDVDAASYCASMDEFLLHQALQAVNQSVSRANEYVDRQAPWKLARDPGSAAALDETLATLARKLAIQTVLLAPFMPGKAQSVWEQLGGPGDVHEQRITRVAQLDPSGWRVTKGVPLFPRETPAPA